MMPLRHAIDSEKTAVQVWEKDYRRLMTSLESSVKRAEDMTKSVRVPAPQRPVVLPPRAAGR